MKRKYERIVAGFLSASMLFSICMPGAVAATTEGTQGDQANYVELKPETVTYGAPVADPEPTTGPAPGTGTTDGPSLDITTDEDGNVNVDVVDRPESSYADQEVEWNLEEDLKDEDADEFGKQEIKADAEGSETYTPGKMETDGEGRVTEDAGKIEGEETVETEVTEKPKHETVTGPEIESDAIPGSKPAESQPEEGEGGQTPGEPTEGGDGGTTDQPEEGGQTGGSESTTETTDKPTADAALGKNETTGKTEWTEGKDTWDLTEDDLRDLVPKPEAPTEEGWKTAEDGNSSESSSTVTADDGTVTKTDKTWERVEYTSETDDGQLIAGYKETTVETVEENGKIAPDMSDRPENAKDVTREDGMVGYCYTEVITDENGVRVETFYTVYPEQGTYTKTTKTTTTKLTYAEQSKEGSVTVKVENVTAGTSHGQLSGNGANGSIQGPQVAPEKHPDSEELNTETGLRDYIFGGSVTGTEIGNGNFVWNSGLVDGKEIAVALASIYKVERVDVTADPRIYRLVDANGTEFYVYCVDAGQDLASGGSGYNMENLQDSDYFYSDDWVRIESIAVNGYWGTKAGETGSLEAFKKMLKASNPEFWTKDRLDKFNDGMALSATQAALWMYGTQKGEDGTGGKPTDSENPFLWKATSGTGYADGTAGLSTTEQQLLMKAYETLLQKATDAVNNKTPSSSTDLIDAEDITNVSVTINSKEEEKNADGRNVYDTNLSFTMAVQPSRMNEKDLTVTVTVGNNTYTYTLPDANGDGGSVEVERTDGKNDVTYVLKGIKMPDGTEVSINLTGTQTLDKSAYLLTATGGYRTSQSFVGIFEGERKVDVNVSLRFDAEQPTATITTDTTVEQVVQQEKQTSWAASWLEHIFYPSSNEPEEPKKEKPKEEPKETVEVEPEIVVEEPEQIIAPEPTTPKVEGIVPKTGDDAAVWMVLCALSVAGLAALNLPKKKAEQEV